MLRETLKKYFGFSEFRPGQVEILENILNGRDTLALMPTGGGKSLCYQLPALVKENTTLVISPLIALMKDQVDALNAKGIKATFINSSLTPKQSTERINGLLGDQFKLVYIAPERFAQDNFVEILNQVKLDLIAVDEAHCVSHWGHDFRPDYLKVRQQIEKLNNRPALAAFTATATKEVKDDIILRLGLKDPGVFIRGFDRPNLRFFTHSWLQKYERQAEVLRLVQSMHGSGIVYADTRDRTEELAYYLKKNGVNSAPYHAGLNKATREMTQDKFMNDQIKVVVATIAFGMGVDKPDVRFVIHAAMPSSLEGYYQEAGRAGRDGQLSYCILLHSPQDRFLHEFFIKKGYEDSISRGKPRDEARQWRNIKTFKLEQMERYTLAKKCRRNIILDYFDDHESKHDNCHGCDVCLDYQWKTLEDSEKSETRNKKLGVHSWDTSDVDEESLFENDEDYILYKKLRGKRNGLAKALGIQKYMVVSDKILEDLAKIKPRTREEFLAIEGISQGTFNKFGEHFTEVMKSFFKKKDEAREIRDNSEYYDDVLDKGLNLTTARTVKLYRQGLTPTEIAHERGLNENTIFGHLLDWYEQGGEFRIDEHLDPEKEKIISSAIKKLDGNIEKLSPIKELCDEGVEYAEIRMVLAKIKK